MAGHFDGLIPGGKNSSQVLQNMARQLESRAWDSLFSGLGGGGGNGLLGMNNFLGFLGSGGRIGAGQFAIGGERGPEIVTGPANVTSWADTARIMRRPVQQVIWELALDGQTDPAPDPAMGSARKNKLATSSSPKELAEAALHETPDHWMRGGHPTADWLTSR